MPMMGGMDTPSPNNVEKARIKAQRLCDVHRLALRDMPFDNREAHLAWLGRVEVTRMEYMKALDAYTRLYRRMLPA